MIAPASWLSLAKKLTTESRISTKYRSHSALRSVEPVGLFFTERAVENRKFVEQAYVVQAEQDSRVARIPSERIFDIERALQDRVNIEFRSTALRIEPREVDQDMRPFASREGWVSNRN